MVFRVELCFAELDDNFVHRAGEFERRLVFAHRCTGVFAEAQRLVRRDAKRDGARVFTFDDCLAVCEERGGAAFAESGSVIVEIDDDGLLPVASWCGPVTVVRSTPTKL